MQVVYFPYLNLKDRDEVSFGDVKIWNLDKVAKKYIPNEKLRNKIERLLHSNVKRGRPLANIGVLSIGECDFRHFSPDEFRTANEVRLMMFLGFLARNNVNASNLNAGHYMATSENFVFVVQNFEPESEYISQQEGFLVHRLDGGYTIGKLLFHAPPFVAEPLQFRLDTDLIKQLMKIKKRNKTFVERATRATEFMFEGYFNNPHLSINARVLLMTAAFEVLLDLPEKSERKAFKEKVKQYTAASKAPKVRYRSERGKGKEWEIENIKVMWADKFYTLRNHIIHGLKVEERDYDFKMCQSHFDIAPLFFILLLKELINVLLKKEYFCDDVKWGELQNEMGKHKAFIYEENNVGRKLTEFLRANGVK